MKSNGRTKICLRYNAGSREEEEEEKKALCNNKVS
jgi:hypothetical protein